MLPILEFPSVVTRYADHFDSLFHNSQQQQHFREYVSGLILAEQATIDAMHSLFVERNDQSALNKFVTQAVWNEEELNRRRVQLEVQSLQRDKLTAPRGYLIIDDTLTHHVGQHIQLIAKLWDHAEQRYTWAHRFPVNFRLWSQFQEKEERQSLLTWRTALGSAPTRAYVQAYLLALIRFQARQRAYHTKQELGQELVRDAAAQALPFATVLFDGWYLHLGLIEAIEQCHKDWIGGLPKDRLVDWQGRWVQVQAYLKTIPSEAYRRYEIQGTPYWVFTKALEVKSLKRRVRIIASYDNADLRGEPKLRVTNRKDWEPTKILTSFLYRWPTETFNEDAKQHLGLEDYQLRKIVGIKRHWYLVFLAYSLLRLDAEQSRLLKVVTAGLETTGQRCRATAQEMVRTLVLWAYKQAIGEKSAAQILQALGA
jgi:SRSO17 transposase